MNNTVEFERIRKKYQNVCLFCKKDISVLCGTPIIMLGGCCFCYRTKKVFYCFTRRAHIHCWLRKNGLKIIKVADL